MNLAFDVNRAREETPGCENVLHFNNAGAALMPRQVLDAVTNHLKLEAAIGGYEALEASAERVEHVYDAAAELIGCSRDEIAIVENATRAWDMAFYAIPFNPGDRILTSMAEYASNFIAHLQVAKKTGARVEVIPGDADGCISLEELERAMDERVKLVSLTHIPTNGGLVNPAEEVGAIARRWGALYLLDACQSVGQMPLDVNRLGCHMLSATSRKFLRGPRGMGFLYMNRNLISRLEPPLLDAHAATWTSPDQYEIRPDARRFENWEANYAGKIGLGVAIDYALSWGIDSIWVRVSALAQELRQRLDEIPRVTVRDLGRERCGIVTFSVDGKKPEKIRQALRDVRMNVSVSPARFTLLDMKSRGLHDGLVRASVHYYNTSGEIDRFCRTLQEMT
ncbi:MAG: aminotransferase class V-fold PLP-dependent enzyme [Deltaproteobacteria bacterium]|nr:aminotransferase class V-fold PLP-dependent enzyme [Deltaproteobacteria bacterium]